MNRPIALCCLAVLVAEVLFTPTSARAGGDGGGGDPPPPPPTQVPLRIVRACLSSNDCPDVTLTDIVATLDMTNYVYADADLEFYVRSDDEFVVPELADLSLGWAAWGGTFHYHVKSVFPSVDRNAWPDGTSKELLEWVRALGEEAAGESEIVIWVNTLNGGLSYSSFPEIDPFPAVMFDPENFVTHRYLLGHEIGHIYGLRHTFDINMVKGFNDPQTQQPQKMSDFWDLVFVRGTSPSDPHTFFASQSAAAAEESNLVPIDSQFESKISWTFDADQFAYVDIGSNSGGAYYETYVSTEPPLKGLSWWMVDNQSNGVFALNMMGYTAKDLTNFFAAFTDTQITMLKKYKDYSIREKLGSHDFLRSDFNFCNGTGQEAYVGFFDFGDRSDLLCNDRVTGEMKIELNDARGEYLDDYYWKSSNRNFCVGSSDELHVGDYNGDGKDDILCRTPTAIEIDYALGWGAGASFPSTEWTRSVTFCTGSNEKLYVGDYDGDDRDDLLCYDHSSGLLQVDLADGSGEFTGVNHSSTHSFCQTATGTMHVGDYDWDGRSDLLCNFSDGSIAVDLAETGGHFSTTDWTMTGRNFCQDATARIYVGDYNGDGRDDILCNQQSNGQMWIDYADSNGEFAANDWTKVMHICEGSGDLLFAGRVSKTFNPTVNDDKDDVICLTADGAITVDVATGLGFEGL